MNSLLRRIWPDVRDPRMADKAIRTSARVSALLAVLLALLTYAGAGGVVPFELAALSPLMGAIHALFGIGTALRSRFVAVVAVAFWLLSLAGAATVGALAAAMTALLLLTSLNAARAIFALHAAERRVALAAG